jgi:hypothetical protein
MSQKEEKLEVGFRLHFPTITHNSRYTIPTHTLTNHHTIYHHSLHSPLGYYERLFKQLHSQIQGETFTGLLLIYPSHIVHIVEVTSYTYETLMLACVAMST